MSRSSGPPCSVPSTGMVTVRCWEPIKSISEAVPGRGRPSMFDKRTLMSVQGSPVAGLWHPGRWRLLDFTSPLHARFFDHEARESSVA